MSTKPKPPTPGTAPLLKNAAGAPVIYFDKAPVFGTFCGNLEVELAARLLMPKPDGTVAADMSCVAHLRCSPQAAIELIDALQKALGILSDQQAEQSELLKDSEVHLAN